jgi:hypothetical protein
MTYSVDFRKKVVAFVRNGRPAGSGTAFRYQPVVCAGLASAPGFATPAEVRAAPPQAIQGSAAAHVRDYLDALVRERAAHFCVYPNAISVALKSKTWNFL